MEYCVCGVWATLRCHIVIARYAFGYLAYCCIMVSQILVFVTLLLRLVSLLHTVSNISKIVSIMVSQNSHCCYTFYIMVSLLLTVSNISKTKSIMVSLNSHFVSLVTLWSHCAELTKRCKSKELYILL